ncbi:MAG: MBL fold metallo-hydrolase [Oscillospiraceae bacterium]|nr:MBL fold metallo-hydrolase [Oscillospiraceae bacterium]
MIRLLSVGSGSSGNCFYLEINGKKLLIDLGLPAKTIRNALKTVGCEFGDIDAVLITHTHSDHIRGLAVSRKHLSCPIYSSEISCAALFPFGPVPIPIGRPFEVADGINVTAFETSHDCPGSIGFRFDYEGGAFGYATDLGCMTERIRETLKGCECIVLESNHDTDMLRSGPYPYVLKRRILSDSGHLSNESCAEAAAFFARNGTENLFLAHLSRENNDPETALRTAEEALKSLPVSVRVLSPGCDEAVCIE